MVSVVVPVYNVEQYLIRCIESILRQSYKDYEIILIDDGSTDASGSICDDYQEKYSFITVIHQQNKGLSVTRNVGTEKAKGDFIFYLDSDDMIHPECIKILTSLQERYSADIACCEFKFFSNENELSDVIITDEEKCMTGEEATENMLYGMLHGTSACAILLKSSIAKQFQFMPNRYHEDDFLTFKYYLSAKTVVSSKNRMYFYYQRADSIMHTKYGKIALDELNAADYIFNNCKSLSCRIQNAAAFKKFISYSQVLIQYPEIKHIDVNTYIRIKNGLLEVQSLLSHNKQVGKKMHLYFFLIRFFGIHFFQIIASKLGI